MGSTLSKGQNAPLPGGPVTVTVDVATAADLSGLMVTDSGKVRSDADFIFFNQPVGPGVRCLAPEAGEGWRLVVDPASVPPEIAQIRAVITLENGRFGDVAPPTARVRDAAGNVVADFTITGLQAESIVIALELYRRGTDWKVRAVGQGYAGGFAALVTDHGVSVDDEPAPAAPVASAYPPPAAAAFRPPAAPPVDLPPPAAAFPPPSAPPVNVPPSTTGAPPPGRPGEISLRKGGRVDLQKGQKVSLRKEDGGPLTQVRLGLGWDPMQGRGSIDLDASAVMYVGAKEFDTVSFTHLHSNDGSINHFGDNLTGQGEGDDEVIGVDLTRVPPQVTTVAFVITSFQGQAFSAIRNAFCRLVDATTNAELVRYDLGSGHNTTGMVMAALYRSDGIWKLQAIGEGIKARMPGKAAKLAVPFLPTTF
ncbi:Stress response protein SCP2 [Nakamurella panacisegetis]|uniref:Stress response protein SCP2 n=1 Tax=Nakamurella panacisegetis TaxID=1090615 RepID=A0A1H0K700_9ACTN|nr:TerD family protein [Nakamurella panacisegetis]SDO51666.1 Stress response protein SCP2 [Nakamurella panacisegetis]